MGGLCIIISHFRQLIHLGKSLLNDSFAVDPMDPILKKNKYQSLLPQLKELMDDSCPLMSNMANFASILKSEFGHFWIGFYLVNSEKNRLELGPFQGPVACTVIPYDKGVCGKSWKEEKTLIVPDVHQFEGHIACSSESNSEIVVPFLKNNQIIGVLDIDSTEFNSFDETDAEYLEHMLKFL